MMSSRGWHRESYRHSLASRGIKTSLARKVPEIRLNLVAARNIWVFDVAGREVWRTGKEEFDDIEMIRKGRLYKGTPDEILEVLDKKGVDTYVPQEDIDFYYNQYDVVDEARIPFVVFEKGELVDQGNLGWVYVAKELDLDSIPLVVYQL